MSQLKKLSQTPSLSNDEKWEALKADAIEIESILLHQAGAVFTSTQTTINAGKPSMKGLKMWRSDVGFLLELGPKREILETTSVFKSIPAKA